MQHQTIMVQIGNQLFQIQSPLVENNSTNIIKASPKNGLIKIKHASQSNSPSVIADLNSASKVMASNGSRNVVNHQSMPFLQPKGIVSVLPASDHHQPSSLTTPVAKVRPLECKTGQRCNLHLSENTSSLSYLR